MQEAEVYLAFKDIFADVFGRTDIPISPTLSAKDVVGWDSFKQVEITLALEEKYDIRIRTKDLNDVASVGDLVALVLRKANTAQ